MTFIGGCTVVGPGRDKGGRGLEMGTSLFAPNDFLRLFMAEDQEGIRVGCREGT
jgi:hypothetical protein